MKTMHTPLLAAAAAIALGASVASAADLTWNNAVNPGNWSTTDANWSGPTSWSNSTSNNAFFDNFSGNVTLTEAITGGSLSFRTGGNASGAHQTLLTSDTTSDTLSLTSLSVNGQALGDTVGNVTQAYNQRLAISNMTLNVSGDATVQRGMLFVAGAAPILNVSGAIKNADAWSVFRIDSGTVTATGGLDFSAVASKVELNGGILNTPFVKVSTHVSDATTGLWLNGTKVVATQDSGDFLQVFENAGATRLAATIQGGGLTVDSANHAVTIDTVLNGGGGSLTKTGEGTLTLTKSNGYTGGTTVNQGTLLLSGSGTFGSGAVAVKNGAALDLGTTTQVLGASSGINSSGAGNGAVGTITNGTINLNSQNAYLQSGTFTMNLTGGGSSRLWIGGDPSAIVELGGNNTSTFADSNSTIIGLNGGVSTVKLLSATALGPNSQNTQVHSGTLDLNGQTGITVSSIMLVNSNMANSNTGTAASYAGTVTFNGTTASQIGGAGDLTLSGKLTNGGFTKTGNGKLTLSGTTNDYTGATTVAAGVLAVDGTLGATAVSVNGGTLQGIGTIGGTVAVNSATLAPGNSAGTLSMSSSLALANTSTLNWELNGADMTSGSNINDLVAVGTGLTLDGTLNVSELVANSFLGASLGNSWTLFTYGGALTDNTLDLGTMPTLSSGLSFDIDTGTSGLVKLTVVPEPSATAFGLLATAGLLLRRRRA